MRRFLATLVLCVIGASASFADGEWLTSYDQALQASKESSRPILAYFTGSDWCPWCHKLDREVLETSGFRQWASQYVVLLAVDFPRRTTQLASVKKQNHELAEKYKVKGYPTVVVLGSEGQEVARQGYEEGGADHWVRTLRAKVNAWLARHGG